MLVPSRETTPAGPVSLVERRGAWLRSIQPLTAAVVVTNEAIHECRGTFANIRIKERNAGWRRGRFTKAPDVRKQTSTFACRRWRIRKTARAAR